MDPETGKKNFLHSHSPALAVLVLGLLLVLGNRPVIHAARQEQDLPPRRRLARVDVADEDDVEVVSRVLRVEERERGRCLGRGGLLVDGVFFGLGFRGSRGRRGWGRGRGGLLGAGGLGFGAAAAAAGFFGAAGFGGV